MSSSYTESKALATFNDDEGDDCDNDRNTITTTITATAIITFHLLSMKHFSKCFTNIISLNCYSDKYHLT